MNTSPLIFLTLTASAVLAGCAGMPANNPRLAEARSAYTAVQADPHAQDWAGMELKQAGDALNNAQAAWERKDDAEQVNHLAYVASQRAAIVRQTLNMKAADAVVATASAERNRVQLEAREREIDAAQRATLQAKRETDSAQRVAVQAQRETDIARNESSNAQRETQAVLARNQQLEARLQELNAKPTPRGLVITLGDVLFDVDRAELKPGGLRMLDQLVAVLVEYPQRNALIEGFTDSTGSAEHNQALSQRRADAVRMALLRQGIAPQRLAARGHGSAFPVGTNDTEAGRQVNRRVEIVRSGDDGQIIAR